ncbi:hypothetical protein D3C80_1055720 [compost metagenome]
MIGAVLGEGGLIVPVRRLREADGQIVDVDRLGGGGNAGGHEADEGVLGEGAFERDVPVRIAGRAGDLVDLDHRRFGAVPREEDRHGLSGVEAVLIHRIGHRRRELAAQFHCPLNLRAIALRELQDVVVASVDPDLASRHAAAVIGFNPVGVPGRTARRGAQVRGVEVVRVLPNDLLQEELRRREADVAVREAQHLDVADGVGPV